MADKLSFDEKIKLVEQGKIDKKTGKFTSMDAMREAKGFKPGETPAQFNTRRSVLEGAKKTLKATKYGKIAAGVAGAGLALKSYLKSKMTTEEVDKKYMGGPVMKAYKGKMTNIISEDKDEPHDKAAEVRGKRFDKKFKKYALSKEAQLHAKDFDKGLDIAESRAAKEVAYDAGYLDQVNQMSMGGETNLSPKQMKIARMAPPSNKITGADFKAMKASSGKMVMARGCKMGRNKPTKLS